MDEPTSTQSRGNHGQRYTLNLHRFISMPRSLLSRGAFTLIIALAAVAFFSIRHTVFRRPFHILYPSRLDTLRSWSNPLRPLGENNAYPFTSWRNRHSNVASTYRRKSRQMRYWPTYGSSYSRFATYPFALRTDITCGSVVEDFVEEKEVATGDCNGGRLCRARVIITKQGGNIIIQAGYNILYRKGVIDVDKRSKGNVKAVKRSEANKWAKSLLSLIAPRLEGLNCDVATAMISDAIMLTKNDASRCPRTDNPLCTQLETIKTCAVIEPLPLESADQKACRTFLEAEIAVSSFDDLVNKSACDIRPNSNIVLMTVPLCKTMCTAGGCPHEKIIYAELDIYGSLPQYRLDDSDIVNIQNSIAIVFVSLFNTFIGTNIPSCDNMDYGVWEKEDDFFPLFELLVATNEGAWDKSDFPYVIPQHAQEIAAQDYGGRVLGVRYSLPMRLAPYIESQCGVVE